MKKLITALICLCMLLAMASPACIAQDSERVVIYVSTNGNDSAQGTQSAPLKTLAAARDKIRELKANGSSPLNGFVVYIRGGDYSMTECLELSAQDSGTENAPIVYRAYPGEKVTLVGGASIAGSAFQKVTDSSILERIISENARKELMVADLRAMGFSNFGDPYWPGAYSYSMKWLTAPDAASPELFIDGEVQTIARYPNEGFMTVKTVVDCGAIPRNWEPDKVGDPGYVPEGKRDPEDTFEIIPDDDRFKKWTNVPENTALMYGYFWYDWADHTVPMLKVADGKIHSAEPSWYGVKAGQRFYVFNLIEEIDSPGEYYLDRENGRLYIYPPKDLSNADIKFSLLENDLVHINGAEHITFKGLKMTAMRSNAIVINSGNNIEIRDCEMEYTADYAVVMEAQTRSCRVIDCNFHDVNGGVYMKSGDIPNLIAGESVVRNNIFTRFDRINKTYRPAVQLQGVGNYVEHNEMSDAAHCAIQYSGNNHSICYNEIYEVCKQADDMGAIYSGRSWVQRGTQIKYNYLHDIKTDSNGQHGLFIIYFDDRLSEQTVVGNLFVDCQGQAICSNGGRDNVFYNNILVNVEKSYRFNAIVPPDPLGVNPVNLMNSLNTVPWQNDVWKNAYPNLYTILDVDGDATYPNNCYAGNNLLVNCGEKKIDELTIHPVTYERGIFEKDMETAAVDFVDAENGIYLLAEDSPVFKELPNFRQLPVTRMGTYSKRAQSRVKAAVAMAVGSSEVLAMGEETFVDTENQKVTPVIVNSRTFVPVRFISEAMGMNVEFDEQTKEISISGGNITLKLIPGNSAVTKNGVETAIDEAPYISAEGRTMVPLRAISEMLEKQVFWDERGLIIISDSENIVNPTADNALIDYLYSKLNCY